MLNEVMISEKKLNYPNLTNKLILILPLLFIIKNQKGFNISINKTLKPKLILENFNEIKPKIQLFKKIGPYLSKPQANVLNNIILLFEKISKIVSLMEFLSKDYDYKPIVINNITDKKERFNGMLKILEDELPKDIAKTLKPIIEIATNFEKYKGILSTLINLIGASGDSKPNFDNLISSFSSMLGDKDENNMKDMVKMLEIVNILNSPTDKEEQSK